MSYRYLVWSNHTVGYDNLLFLENGAEGPSTGTKKDIGSLPVLVPVPVSFKI